MMVKLLTLNNLVKVTKMLIGCLIVSVGILIMHHAQLVTGGTAGLALSASYFWQIPFSTVFILVNIPFYILSIMRMGVNFTLSTIFSVVSLSFMTEMDRWITSFAIHPFLSAILGGVMIGAGVAFLFSNGSSLGGANILTLYLQREFNWDPGKVNFVIDFAVVLSGSYAVGLVQGLYSVLSIAVLSSVISLLKVKVTRATTTTN
ncbi:YitT family protein [Dendrosporobacter sp. 1207_IL3150]|uniref:YitT family protein n=1 Tax=Dendrosporobacter sp. 1207_IL3150 TaxID=3084054 RepID=UPI002FD8DFCB